MLGSMLRMLGLIGLAAVCGLTQATLVFRLPLVEDTAKLRADEERKQGLRETAGMSLEELLEFAQTGQPIIDARIREQFDEEHLDALIIINMHPARFHEQVEELMPYLGQSVAIYCNSETCTLAEELYLLLEPLGFSDMKIYFPGWEALKAAGAPTVRKAGAGS